MHHCVILKIIKIEKFAKQLAASCNRTCNKYTISRLKT